MFQCYVTPEEFYSGKPGLSNWVTPESAELLIRDASIGVAEELRSRGIDLSRLLVPVMLEGATPYVYKSASSDDTGDAVTGYNACRFVVECSTATDSTFTLEGSNDAATWFPVRGLSYEPIKLEFLGPGMQSAKYFEKYRNYRYKVATDEAVSYSVYLTDSSSVDRLIYWAALKNAMFLVLDSDQRTQELYDASRDEYAETLSKFSADYDTGGDDAISGSETNQRPQPLFHR